MLVTDEGYRWWYKKEYGIELPKDKYYGIDYKWSEQEMEMAMKILDFKDKMHVIVTYEDGDIDYIEAENKIIDLSHHYLWEKRDIVDVKFVNCGELMELNIRCQKLTHLDVSELTELRMLRFNWNHIKEIDLSNNKKLRWLSCQNNFLRELDLSHNTELKLVCCAENHRLCEINLSNCTELLSLLCDYNDLSEIDLTDCKKLIQLDCNYNRLTTLDVSNCPELQVLRCEFNYLSELNISGCLKLIELDCRSNHLTKKVKLSEKFKKKEDGGFSVSIDSAFSVSSYISDRCSEFRDHIPSSEFRYWIKTKDKYLKFSHFGRLLNNSEEQVI